VNLTLTDEQLRQFALDTQAEAFAAGYRLAAEERDDTLLTIADVQKRLGFGSPSPVYERIRKGQLEAIDLGNQYRVRPSALRSYIERHRALDQYPELSAAG